MPANFKDDAVWSLIFGRRTCSNGDKHDMWHPGFWFCFDKFLFINCPLLGDERRRTPVQGPAWIKSRWFTTLHQGPCAQMTKCCLPKYYGPPRHNCGPYFVVWIKITPPVGHYVQVHPLLLIQFFKNRPYDLQNQKIRKWSTSMNSPWSWIPSFKLL